MQYPELELLNAEYQLKKAGAKIQSLADRHDREARQCQSEANEAALNGDGDTLKIASMLAEVHRECSSVLSRLVREIS